jgi:hypothetical protein
MDDTLTRQIDTIVENEIARGYIVKTMPANMVDLLKEAAKFNPEVQVLDRVKFTKLTPRKKRLINEAIVARYHEDLQRKNLLSNDQLRKLNIERGEWSADNEKKIEELQTKTTEIMRQLYVDGVDRRDQWGIDLLEAISKYTELVDNPKEDYKLFVFGEQKAAVMTVFERWTRSNTETPKEGEEYTTDADFKVLFELYPDPEALDLLSHIDDLQHRIVSFTTLLNQRRELLELQLKQARMYSESVESRRETAEELARLFHLTECCDEDGNSLGPIAPSFDKMWDLPDEVIQWLLVEVYFFLNAIPDEARGFLQEWGFIQAPLASGQLKPSEESPVEPSSKPDLPVVKETPVRSSGRKARTTSATSN